MAEKTTLEKLREYDETFEPPKHKVPLLHWQKKVTKKDVKENTRPLTAGNYHDYYYNLNTAECAYFIQDIVDADDYVEENYAIFEKAKYTEPRYYVKYIPELDVLVVGQADLDVSPIGRGCEPTKREFYDRGHFYVDREKKIYYRTYRYDYYSRSYSSSGLEEHEKIDWHIPVNLNGVVDPSHCGLNNEPWSEAAAAVTKMFNKVCNVGANRMTDITEHPWFFEEFIKYKEPRVRKGPKNDRIQKLIKEHPLARIEDKATYPEKVAFIEKIEDGFCVLRTMQKENGNPYLVDAARVYVGKKEIIACRPNNAGEWVNMVLRSNMINWQFELEDFDKETVKDTMLEYFGEVVEDVPVESKGKLIFAMLSYPIIESLAKIGLKNYIINTVCANSYSKAIAPIEDAFGKIDPNKKKLLDALGLNKYQFKKVSEYLDLEHSYEERTRGYYGYYGNYNRIVINIKDIFDDEYTPTGRRYYRRKATPHTSIASIDNKTFDTVFNALVVLDSVKLESYYDKDGLIRAFVDCLAKIRTLYSNQMMLNMINPLIAIFSKKVDSTRYANYAYYEYFDYLDMVSKLNDTANFRPNFDPKDVSSIKEMHDAAVTVYNLKKDAIKAEEFKGVASRWDKWVYAGEKFSAVAPKTPEDIANEGMTLRHCVKSYIDRVIAKTTNIMFIRKNEELETPFFTVEVSNDGRIEQVHGSCNRNSCTEPFLDDFIKVWAKECKLKPNGYNKVR